MFKHIKDIWWSFYFQSSNVLKNNEFSHEHNNSAVGYLLCLLKNLAITICDHGCRDRCDSTTTRRPCFVDANSVTNKAVADSDELVVNMMKRKYWIGLIWIQNISARYLNICIIHPSCIRHDIGIFMID